MHSSVHSTQFREGMEAKGHHLPCVYTCIFSVHDDLETLTWQGSKWLLRLAYACWRGLQEFQFCWWWWYKSWWEEAELHLYWRRKSEEEIWWCRELCHWSALCIVIQWVIVVFWIWPTSAVEFAVAQHHLGQMAASGLEWRIATALPQHLLHHRSSWHSRLAWIEASFFACLLFPESS